MFFFFMLFDILTEKMSGGVYTVWNAYVLGSMTILNTINGIHVNFKKLKDFVVYQSFDFMTKNVRLV